MHGPSLNAAALSTFAAYLPAMLDELESLRSSGAAAPILASLLACLVCALGASAAVSYALAILQTLLALASWVAAAAQVYAAIRIISLAGNVAHFNTRLA